MLDDASVSYAHPSSGNGSGKADEALVSLFFALGFTSHSKLYLDVVV